MGGLNKQTGSKDVSGVRINDSQSVHTKQMHEFIFSGISCRRNAIFFEAK